MERGWLVALAVLVVALFAAGAVAFAYLYPFYETPLVLTESTDSTLYPNPGGASTGPTGSFHGSFQYPPSPTVRVISVQAAVQPGTPHDVVFSVTYQNIGNSSITYVEGGDSSLVANVTSQSGVIQKVSSGPLCNFGDVTFLLAPGANTTASTPTCRSGYAFHLAAAATATVVLTLSWTSGPADTPGSANITATFLFDAFG